MLLVAVCHKDFEGRTRRLVDNKEVLLTGVSLKNMKSASSLCSVLIEVSAQGFSLFRSEKKQNSSAD